MIPVLFGPRRQLPPPSSNTESSTALPGCGIRASESRVSLIRAISASADKLPGKQRGERGQEHDGIGQGLDGPGMIGTGERIDPTQFAIDVVRGG